MKRVLIFTAVLTAGLVLLVVAGGPAVPEPNAREVRSFTTAPGTSRPGAGQPFLYGRIVTTNDGTYEGRLRFGGSQEAFWGDYFNGYRPVNPWAEDAGFERPIEIFGFALPLGKHARDLGRPMMARFGDLSRIDAAGRRLQVTLKSGTVLDLDRYAADDFADGVRVWDERRGVADLDEWRMRSIEFLPGDALAAAPARLYGTVQTPVGSFTGFVQWNRGASLASDAITGNSADGVLRLQFEAIRAIARRTDDSALVTMRDGREVVLSGTRDVGREHRGVYVDDLRYGRVLVSWDAFERLDLSPGRSGPAYTDYPPGHALTGSVVTRDGRRLTGRLVFDLDESETTETLDAPSGGVTYTIPLGLVATIVPAHADAGTPHATVRLHDGEDVPLEPAGDLGDGNAGLLIFVAGSERPEYVAWADVLRIDLDRPPAMYPTLPRLPSGEPGR